MDDIIKTEDGHFCRCKWLKDNAKEIKGYILDIGCADNWLMPELKNAVHIDMVDPSKVVNKENYFRSDAHHLPFKDKRFDIVIMGDILEHVAKPVDCIKEAIRVSKRICATVPNEHAWDETKRPFTNACHVRYYTCESIKKDFEDAGTSPNIQRMDGGGWSFFLVTAPYP